MKSVVVGMGNEILCDDGIGIHLVRRLRPHLKGIEVLETSVSGMYLVDLVIDYQRAIFIDAMKTGTRPIGDVCLLRLEDFQTQRSFSAHTTDFFTALELARTYGVNVPEDINFVGIEVKDTSSFREAFSSEVESLEETIYKRVRENLGDILGEEIWEESP